MQRQYYIIANLIKMAKNSTFDHSSLIIPGYTDIYANEHKAKYYKYIGQRINNVILIPLENEVFYPYMQIVHTVSHPQTVASIKKAYKNDDPVFLFLASDSLPEDLKVTEIEDVYESLGTLGFVDSVSDNADGSVSFTATLWHKGIIINLLRRAPYMRSDIDLLFPKLIDRTEDEKLIAQELDELYLGTMKFLSEKDREQLLALYNDVGNDTVRKLYFMMQNSPLTTDFRYELLSYEDFSEMRKAFLSKLKEQFTSMQLRAETHHKAIEDIAAKQREELLRSHLQQIKKELGDTAEDDEEELRERALQKNWTSETEAYFQKELRKLMRFNPNSPDYAIQYSFLDNFLNLPWLHCDNSTFTLGHVEDILDKDHYGLEKVKDRIIDYMAVLKLRNDTKSPILCLYGPPGVGKTSLGKSIAEALGRKYARVALGGLHDEAEIRGHRRTYLGSMPGRILTALEKCGTSDPVMVLDEIDKIGADYKGDPAQALLEVLDPEQNFKFHDNYIDHDYDLSKVLFIATANTLQGISAPLLDRMELIEVSGYAEDEKIEIAARHLLPHCLEQNGFEKNEIKFVNEAFREIINNYTHESGVRQLEKKINKILRKLARLKASGKPMTTIIEPSQVAEYLGKPEVFNNLYEDNLQPGVVTGLAWTQAGGEILFIESSIAPGKDGKLILTGSLGDVMKESAMIALQYVKANHDKLGIPKEKLTFETVHVNVPEGAVPKDGPSAGITILTSLVSAFTDRKVRSHIAMTGEMTLRGKVLPVGGIKEKVLAAKRAGIKTIIMSSKNRKDIDEINEKYLEGLKFHFVDSTEDVLSLALE